MTTTRSLTELLSRRAAPIVRLYRRVELSRDQRPGRSTNLIAMPTPGTSGADELGAWLDAFTHAVRSHDTGSGRALFDHEAVGYGTLGSRLVGLDELVERQWTPTWRRIVAWDIRTIDLCEASGATGLIAFTWARETSDGPPVSGRATLVLRQGATGWRCIHSHFSADPRTDPSGYW
jgi:hypothetical protein